MSSTNTRKRKSDQMEESTFAVTPTGSPASKKMRITEAQKQALMDNLQLEITERARQLRAGYALQCADLRARIERRVNRIPLAIRKMTMGELMEKHDVPKQAQSKTQSKPTRQTQAQIVASKERPLPALPPQEASKTHSPARPQPQSAAARGKKRKSSEIHIASDKENDATGVPDTLPVAKNNKRAKTAATTSGPTKQSSVLSPRSHNSRTLPRSPIKDYPIAPSSPAKSMIARPTSPLKPASPFKTAATAATSAISASMHGMFEHAKRSTTAKMTRTASKEKPATNRGQMLPPPRPPFGASSSPQRTISQNSTHSVSTDVSTASSSTTLVKPKRGRPATTKTTDPKSPGATAKRGVAKAASAAKTALKRNATTANKKVVVAEPAAGKRVLRKRP
ncbi:Borealin N terminal-domain-containing protein [Exophiala viscosa]|uniref:Borealin N terminal-domain-containing protein n=1 Tax=Exophiala viscosa TaxID=2486360 RepID=A0AAN6IC88_9EURO|nr:Borealin N terminal-domain-containing protein [Exophiala viscosa]